MDGGVRTVRVQGGGFKVDVPLGRLDQKIRWRSLHAWL